MSLRHGLGKLPLLVLLAGAAGLVLLQDQTIRAHVLTGVIVGVIAVLVLAAVIRQLKLAVLLGGLVAVWAAVEISAPAHHHQPRGHGHSRGARTATPCQGRP